MSDAEEKNIEVNLITYNAAISACCLVENHLETRGHASVMISQNSRSRGWRRSTATLWWCEIHGHGAGCSLADVHRPDECFFANIHQKGHISKRQEGTNRQAWNMTNVRMKVQRSSLTTLHWPPWRVLAIWTKIFRRSALRLCVDMPWRSLPRLFISRNWQGVSWTSFNGSHLLKENQKGQTAELIHDDSILHELSHSQLCKQEKCRLDICLEDSSWDVLWRDLARQVRGHSYGHLARFWPRCLSVKAPSVWPFSWQQFGMYSITLYDLQHVNCWPVSMCHSSGLHSILQWVLVQKQSSGSRRSILANIWSTMVVRGRGLAVPTNPWNIQHGPTWTPNCSKLKGKSFSNYHDGSNRPVCPRFFRNY